MFHFGPHKCPISHAFASTEKSLAFVNLKPLVPGHVLVIPKRLEPRFTALAAEEVRDLFGLAHLVACRLETYYQTSALTVAIQDGPEAGQSVPHVHVHILPRRKGDFDRNDEIYAKLEERMHDELRPERSSLEMTAEASLLRSLFNPDSPSDPALLPLQ